ncbi:MAG: hypothetical protein EAX86_10255 [Candidatus Heimdallarchaeota archaeon]|nr:hypothetical protein [Candidatus Heimdallarchaeota archaeon]
MDQIEEAAVKIFNAIFNNQKTIDLNGECYRIQKTRTGLRNVTFKGIWFIEQNPNKDSSTAKLAREGHKLLWGIKGRTYIIKVLDGKYERLH